MVALRTANRAGRAPFDRGRLEEAYARVQRVRAGTAAHADAGRQAEEAAQRLGILVGDHCSTKAIVRAVDRRSERATCASEIRSGREDPTEGQKRLTGIEFRL